MLVGRAGVLASIFLPHPAKPSSFLGPEAHPWDQRWPYVLLTVHVALVLMALTHAQKDRAQLWPERAAVWLLLVATAFLAGQSDDRWNLVLVVSEMAVVVFGCGGLTDVAAGRKPPHLRSLGHDVSTKRHLDAASRRATDGHVKVDDGSAHGCKSLPSTRRGRA